jgi:hypothetical protein
VEGGIRSAIMGVCRKAIDVPKRVEVHGGILADRSEAAGLYCCGSKR